MSRRSRERMEVWQAKHYQSESDVLSRAFQEMHEITRQRLEQYSHPMTAKEHREFLQEKENAAL